MGLAYTSFGFPCVRTDDGRAIFVAASPADGPAVVELDVASGETKVLREASDERVDAAYVSLPKAIEFPTDGGRTAHAFYYPPRNRDFEGLEGEPPPLRVRSHGGPTSHSTPALRLGVPYWTSRGFGVVEVNYGGSTGFGREYRGRLNPALPLVPRRRSEPHWPRRGQGGLKTWIRACGSRPRAQDWRAKSPAAG